MTRRDKRWVARVACQIPARIQAKDGWLEAKVLDLSRTGMRLGVRPELLELDHDDGLGAVTKCLAEVFPERLYVELNHGMLGVLIVRRSTIRRVAQWQRHSPYLELGCGFEPPLADDEAAALGIALPHEGETQEDARQRLRPKAPHHRDSRLRVKEDKAGVKKLLG